MHEIARNLGREILVGTTDMLTPRDYIRALRKMKELEENPRV